ncbi:hypothetical protein ACJ6WE_37760 [Streptomyces sp. MMS24-I31]|uniref:hypothetical protein n=1 Tax=Streptomyces sp. MMS24-I31 TaxID=3351563 RepID=UPI0038968697
MLAGAVVVGAAHPAYPHDDTITFRISLDRSGRVLALGTYENDKDPLDETVIGTLTAQASDGRTTGPWRLVPAPHVRGGFTTRQGLSEGRWRITIRSAFPELGYGVGSVTVPKAMTRPPTHDQPTKASAPSPSHSHNADDNDDMRVGQWITGAMVAMVVCALLAGRIRCHRRC